MIGSVVQSVYSGVSKSIFAGKIHSPQMPSDFLLGKFPFIGENGELPSENYEIPGEYSWLGSVKLPTQYPDIQILGETTVGIKFVAPYNSTSEILSIPYQIYGPLYIAQGKIQLKDGDTIAEFYTTWNAEDVISCVLEFDTENGMRVGVYDISPLSYEESLIYRDSTPTTFFNGFDFTNCTYTGGILPEFDNSGALVSPGVNIPSIRGARLATTVVDGAMLGPELIADYSASKWLPQGSNLVSQEDGTAVKITYVDNDFGAKIYLRISTGVLVSTTTIPKGERLLVRFKAKINTGVARATVSSDSSSEVFLNTTSLTNTFTDYLVEFTNNDNVGGYIGIFFRNLSAGEVVWITDVSAKKVIPTYVSTDISGAPIVASVEQKTRTGNADFSAFTPSTTFPRFDISDPLKMPGWLCAPARTNYALNSATPATQTTGSLSIGTYTLWQEGSGSVVATAGTAVGTFGTASNGNPATITITTAGTVVLTVSGTNTWLQFEKGEFKTPRITTATASATRAGTVASHPTAGYIRSTDMAMRMIVVPRATGQSTIYLYGTYVDANNYTAIVVTPTSVILRKMVAGVQTDATVSYTHSNGVPVEVVTVRSSVGMRIAVRQYSGGTWSAWTIGTLSSDAAAKTAAQIGAAYQLGSLNSANQFYGNIEEFEPLLIPPGTADPMVWAMAAYDRTNTDTQINVSPDEFLINDETFINDSTTMFA